MTDESMGALVAFLRARLEEDEQAANNAAYSTGGEEWTYRDLTAADLYDPELDQPGPFGHPVTMESLERKVAKERPGVIQLADLALMKTGVGDVVLDGHIMEHIALHDPARVLRDVKAKRRAVDLCVEWINRPVGQIDRIADDAFVEAGESMLRLLTLPYADHEGYDERWRP